MLPTFFKKYEMKNVDILIKLATMPESDFLHKTYDHGKWNFGAQRTIRGVPHCGTRGCLASELPGLTTDWSFDEEGELLLNGYDSHKIEQLAGYFDISNFESRQIFGLQELDEKCTRKEAQENLIRFLIEKGVSVP